MEFDNKKGKIIEKDHGIWIWVLNLFTLCTHDSELAKRVLSDWEIWGK